MFYTQSVVRILYLVRVLYSVRSPHFIPSPCFIPSPQSVVHSPWSMFYTDRSFDYTKSITLSVIYAHMYLPRYRVHSLWLELSYGLDQEVPFEQEDLQLLFCFPEQHLNMMQCMPMKTKGDRRKMSQQNSKILVSFALKSFLRWPSEKIERSSVEQKSFSGDPWDSHYFIQVTDINMF